MTIVLVFLQGAEASANPAEADGPQLSSLEPRSTTSSEFWRLILINYKLIKVIIGELIILFMRINVSTTKLIYTSVKTS